MTLGETARRVSDGSKSVIITTAIKDRGALILFAFGETEPTHWHVYVSVTNDPLIVSPEFGKLWVKTAGKVLEVVVSEGIA